jgi:tripartite-type tricarboxylate transporter receptor subunit TctC
MIVAFAPGGGTDLTARAIAPYIEKNLGPEARIVVVNRPGAGGEIGFAAIADAAPDGYTIGFINTPNVVTIPIERQARYSVEKLDSLGNIIDDPGNFSVHAESPIKSLADLAAAAKARPGQINVGTTGVGSDDHLAMLLFQRIAGVRFNHVPFNGSGPVRAAMQGRHIDVAAINVGEALQFAQADPLRQLGQMSPKRTTLAPDLPTFKEQGFDIELASLRGMAAPKGIPADIRKRLVDAVAKAANDPEFQAKAKQLYAPLRFMPPEEHLKAIAELDKQFRQLWTEMKWNE